MAKEIELRSIVDSAHVGALLADIERLADYRVQRRCFIDYSTFLEGIGERKLDVRVRVTDTIPEIIVKRGTFGGAVREEAALAFSEEKLEGALAVMALLGYGKGVAGGRRIHKATDGGIELSLQEVLDFHDPDRVGAYFLEVEAIEPAWTESEAISRLSAYLSERGMRPLPEEDWNYFVAQLNETLNGVYTFGETDAEVIRRLGA